MQNRLNNQCASCLGQLIKLASAVKFPVVPLVLMNRHVNAIVCRNCFKLLSEGSLEDINKVRKAIYDNLTPLLKDESLKRQISRRVKRNG